ncbi:MAG: anthranilate synthase component I [Candidatus Latescibacteria bacterium]|nr:anthranilate synthase component I [Candidatus Latescibacterota bacterium]
MAINSKSLDGAATPSFDDVTRLASEGTVLPVHRRILADTETPVSAFLKIRDEDPYTFLLESVEGEERAARYSFLGVDPFLIFRAKRERSFAQDRRSGSIEERNGDPLGHLRELTERYRSVQLEGLPRFTGGAVGYLGYDCVRWVEDIPDDNPDELDLDDSVFMFFDRVLAFDNLAHEIIIIVNIDTDTDDENLLRERYDAALPAIAHVEKLLAYPVNPRPVSGRSANREVISNTKQSDFEESVDACKEYIFAGDVFQVVPSQRFQTPVSVGSFDIYRRLRTVNPSPYMFFLSLESFEVVGASPETLVRVEGRAFENRPIAGTARRGANEEEDRKAEEELLADPKERAEHLMLVDLGRNDVGRVAKYDTVHVTDFMIVERYSHVMHIVSNVRGELRDDCDRFDALLSCFPAGTLTGAPKIRAMEIIDEIESTRRGIYGGAVGYLDFGGNLDTCIAIRTMVVKDGIAYAQAGGGIVADSVPATEYQETVNKASALLKAVDLAEASSAGLPGDRHQI